MIIPDSIPVQYTIVPMTSYLLYVDNDGVLYKGTTILSKSIDAGQNWSNVNTFSANVGKVAKVSAGNIVVMLENGEIWRSDADGANFTKVFTLDTEATGIQNLEQYGNLMFVAAWGLPPNIKRDVAISRDCGATWALATPIPEITMNHTHAICYDPYEGLLWVTCGDTPQGRRLWFSDDLGVSWQTTDDVSHRTTNIMPFPDKVLFGSDEKYEAFTWEYNRVKRGTSGVKIKLEKNWVPVKWVNEDFESTWATRPAIVYGQNPVAYFGFRQAAGATMVPVVWGTDGERYFPMWKGTKIPSQTVIPAGILGVWIDKDGKIYAALRDDVGEESHHVVIIG